MNRLGLVVLGGALVVFSPLFSCGPAVCDATSCSRGCCSAAGKCETGFDEPLCGRSGVSCSTCTQGQLCMFGMCNQVTGGGRAGGTATGGGSTAGGRAGGSAGGSTAGGRAGGTAGGAAGGASGGMAGGSSGGAAGGASGGTSGGMSGGAAGGRAGGSAGGSSGGAAGGSSGGMAGGTAGGSAAGGSAGGSTGGGAAGGSASSCTVIPTFTGVRGSGSFSGMTSTQGFAANTANDPTDIISLDFYWDSMPLPVTRNLNTSTFLFQCTSCAVLKRACTFATQSCGSNYFARAGSMTVTAAPRGTTGTFTAGLSNARFDEWDLTADEPVDGGRCVTVTSATLSVQVQ